MKLVIFDIDGTLTLTNESDEICFLKTAQTLISADIHEIIPEAFTHYTDQNIVRELYLWHKGYEPSLNEIEDFKFLLKSNLLESAHHKPEGFHAVSGAVEMLSNLGEDWQIGLATGCWSFSAEIKLSKSGICLAEFVPISNSDKAMSRLEILQNAINTAIQSNRNSAFDKIVYVGDGIWDLKTCAALKIPFVGIEAEGRVSKKTALGKFYKLENYLNLDFFKECLELAEIPNEIEEK
jgi:phosphoglycolate phosphatase-like HAD superfamily hydrolase